ncbi:MAG: head maturation protease, ClpP-related [Actinomycetota bacterium]
MSESLSEKRRRAGVKGAQARWGARNAPPAAGTDSDGDDLVFGNASQLREMAEAMEHSDNRTLARARAVSANRVTAYRSRRPQATAADLAGRVVCEALPDDIAPPRDGPRLRVVNEDADVAELWLYDYIDSWGGYWGISAAEVVEQLADITATRIDVHINSPGGEVFEGIAIKRALAAHDADIYVCVDGVAASIATVIAMAGDTIGMEPAAMMMIHEASGFCYGTAGDMLSMAGLLDKVSDVIAGVYQARAGDTVKDWRTRMLAETWYTAAEAIDVGLADEYLDAADTDADVDEPAAATDVRPSSLLSALVASTRPAPEPPAALSFLRAVKEAHST